ncbi:MAG: hypothetical protein P1U56_25955 [Saprospiraceae bacterium]|nr:hypothetical protein [Saprospiraceae bacterium]
MDNIKIGRSRIKTFLLILGAIGFVLCGAWMIKSDETDLFEKIIGGISIIFFGGALHMGIKKLFTNEDAIEFNNYNLIIEPNSDKRIVIPWNKILGFDEVRIKGAKIITIKVSNPQEWINGERNSIKKKLMQFNNNNYKTPFNITSSGLNISHEKLFELLNKHHKESKY